MLRTLMALMTMLAMTACDASKGNSSALSLASAQYESGQFDRARTTAKPMLKQAHPESDQAAWITGLCDYRQGAWTMHASSFATWPPGPHRNSPLRRESCWHRSNWPRDNHRDALPASTGPGRICHPFTDAAQRRSPWQQPASWTIHPQSTSGSIECRRLPAEQHRNWPRFAIDSHFSWAPIATSRAQRRSWPT